MQPISPIGAGSAGPVGGLNGAQGTGRATAGADQSSLARPSAFGQLQGFSQLQRAMGNLIRASALDPQSQRLLQLMIGLLILLAILDALRPGQGSSGGATDALTALMGGAAQETPPTTGEEGVNLTTIDQSTNTTIVMQSPSGYDASTNDAPQNQQGIRLDIVG